MHWGHIWETSSNWIAAQQVRQFLTFQIDVEVIFAQIPKISHHVAACRDHPSLLGVELQEVNLIIRLHIAIHSLQVDSCILILLERLLSYPSHLMLQLILLHGNMMMVLLSSQSCHSVLVHHLVAGNLLLLEHGLGYSVLVSSTYTILLIHELHL